MRTSILLLAACGGASSTTSIGNHEPLAVVRVPCPKPAEVDKLAAKTWRAKAMTGVDCTPVWRGRAYWWLSGSEQNLAPPSEALVATDGTVAWTHANQPSPDEVMGIIHQRAVAADLDGDGNDEVVYAETMGEGGASGTRLVVMAFTSQLEPVVAGEAEVGWMHDAGDTECTGDWKLVPDGKRQNISVEQSGACPVKRTVYRWVGTMLREIK